MPAEPHPRQEMKSAMCPNSHQPQQTAFWVAVLTGVALALFAPASRAADELKPASTYAVIVGVLKWKDPKVATFPPRHRKDQELRDVLVKRGVPAKNITLLLDEKGTLANIQRAVNDVAGRAGPGSTFLFYYAGHGGMQPGGAVNFLNYDTAPGTQFKLSDLAASLKRRFKGGRVLLMADCCHSGGLATVAKELSLARIKAASVTSAESSNLSAGSWAFTQAVIDALRGEPLVDANGDGTITLGELRREVADAMKYREGQKSGTSDYGVGDSFHLGRATKRAAKSAGPFRLGEYVMAPDAKGKPARPARVVGREGAQYAVEFYDYTDKRVVKLPASSLKRPSYVAYKVGQLLRARWQGKLFAAKILAAKNDFYLITYPGYGKEWDEWVTSARLVSP
jgi:hypothetical protein